MSKFNGSSNQPKISIALATCNGEKFIKEQLDSILNQTVMPFEIIVCDDCSTDATVSILSEYQSKGILKYSVNEIPLGVIRNFQKAVNLCSGDYIALSDQDDVWFPTKLELSLNKMKTIEQADLPCLVYTDLEIVNEKLEIVEKSFWKYLRVNPKYETFKTILYGNVVTGCATVINSVFKKYFSEMPSNVSMHDQWMGLVAYGLGKVGVVTESTVKYRRHEANSTLVDHLSFFGKIKRSVSLALHEYTRSTFLESEISQADMFYKIHKNELSDEKIRDLEDFFRETKSGYLKRKIRKILAKRFNKFY